GGVADRHVCASRNPATGGDGAPSQRDRNVWISRMTQLSFGTQVPESASAAAVGWKTGPTKQPRSPPGEEETAAGDPAGVSRSERSARSEHQALALGDGAREALLHVGPVHDVP